MHLAARDLPLVLVPPTEEPYTTASLSVNLFFRVFLGLVGELVCVVPLRLLYRNNEFAAVVHTVNIMFRNLLVVVNALIWRNDNLASWWPGYGYCDAWTYVHNFSTGLINTCLLAIMRNIATQVGILRANPLSVTEKRRQNLTQALILFPLPLLQLGLTWPLAAQRYAVGTLVGCAWVGYPTWQYLVFFILAPAVASILAAVYAVLIYFRFRQLARTTDSAVSSNVAVNLRAQRTKRRLYLMVVVVLIPFLPVALFMVVINIVRMGRLKPYSYAAIHEHQAPYPWNSIIFLPSDQVDTAWMFSDYMSLLIVIPHFLFFGMSKDALNEYRRGLLFVGLGAVFPRLHEEYEPDRYRGTQGSSSFRIAGLSSKLRSVTLPASGHFGSIGSSSTVKSRTPQPFDMLSSVDTEASHRGEIQRPQPSQQPMSQVEQDNTPIQLPHRHAFLFRTRLDIPSFTLPLFNRSATHTERTEPTTVDSFPPEPPRRANVQSLWDEHEKPQVETRVWSDEEGEKQPGSHRGHRHRHNEGALDEPRAQGLAVHGVVVETALTRESHRSSQD